MRRMPVLVTAALIGSLAAVPAVVPSAAGAAGPAVHPATHPVVLYSSDGMRPDLMKLFAQGGGMPTYSSLMRAGATGDNGLTQGFPPNTGQGWYTMATGAWPGVHGSTNNTFYDVRQDFTTATSFSFHGNGASPGSDPTNVLEAQSVASAAEQAGRKVAQVEWTGGLNANINGPTVDYATFYSRRGLLEYPLNTTKQTNAASFGLSYQVASFTPASGWTNVPASAVPAQQSVLTVPTTFSSLNPDRTFDLYVYATGAAGYDRVLVVPTSAAKDGVQEGRHARARQVQRGQVPRRERPHRRRRRRDDRRLHEAHRVLAGPVALRAVLHLADPAERALRSRRVRRAAGRRAGRGPAGQVHRRQPAAGDLRRLRAAGGRSHRRGQLVPADRRAQPGLRQRSAELRARHAAAGHPGAARGHRPDRRGQPPDARADHADRSGRHGEPVLRPDRRHRPARQPRGAAARLHPRRVPVRRRPARAGPLADRQ